MAEETVILHFEVDQSKAERQLEKIEGLLLDNKQAQQELTKAYKAGNITQEEYVKENIRLQQNIKKEQDQKKALIRTMETESNSRNALKQRVSQLTKEYDNLNLKTAQGAKRADELEKELAQLNSQLTKGDKAAGLFKNQIGNYPAQFAEAAKGINVAGVSVGDITSKLASFANPATAAVGLVTALGAAYANSTRGAKDLEFATNQVAFALKFASNSLAEFISTSGEDGEGIVSQFTFGLTSQLLGTSAAINAALAAGYLEQLEDIQRKEKEIRADASDRIEENQELLERIADDQIKVNDRLLDADKIEKNLILNKQQILAVLNEQLRNLEAQQKLDLENENILDARKDLEAQIKRESAGLEKQITKINKLQDDLNAKLAKEIKLRQKLFEFEVREANKPNVNLGAPGQDVNTVSGTATSAAALSDPEILASNARIKQQITELKQVKLSEKTKREAYLQTAEYKEWLDNTSYDVYMNLLGETTNLIRSVAGEQSDIYKIAASAQTIIATYSGATKAYDSLSGIPYVGPALGAAAAAAAIASGLANLAQINGVEFAEGGWTGPGSKYDVAGVVHADEYVVPKDVNNSPAAQPHLMALERMRGGYADGGFVVNQSTASSQQALIMANAMKNLPVPEVSVKEITRTQNRVRVREKVSTLNS